MLNLIQCGLERSTRFGLENFAHKVRIQGFPERSILYYSSFRLENLKCSKKQFKMF